MPENNNVVPQELQNVENLIPELNEGINNETEPVELTDEEKRAQFIETLKESKKKFKPIKHYATKSTTVLTGEVDIMGKQKKRKDTTILTNITNNQFGTSYKKNRKRKNKIASKSRKANRK